jgi:DNA methylase
MDRIIHGDCSDELLKFPPDSVDLIVTDPPYGYSFMGKDWDKAVPTVQHWEECLGVLKPGAFAFVMSAPREDVLSQMIVRIGEAGFDTSFTSLYWTYANGFPKAANIGKLVDRRLGVTRTIVGKSARHTSNGKQFNTGYKTTKEGGNLSTCATSPPAKALDGSYGGFQPKPAVEVIIVAMKPLSAKSFVDQALKTCKGVTWLDDCRVPIDVQTGVLDTGNATPYPAFNGRKTKHEHRSQQHDAGGFPANLLVSNNVLSGHSRFFSLDSWADNLPFLIARKASKAEKHAGLDHLANKLLARSAGAQPSVKKGGDAYLVQHIGLNRVNNHPTVKPLSLMSYLITLGSRPGDVVLDPFVGSGTTALAAKMLNRRYIGIEREREYVDIARARLKAASSPIQSTMIAAE